jgi:hypothetical protein
MTTSTTPRFPDAHVRLSGEDGNVFGIIGRVRRALIQAGATDEDIKCFMHETTGAGSYDEVLQIVMRWINVS